MTSPYAFTAEEIKMMDKNYKKPKAKKWFVSEKKVAVAKNTLHERGTVATKNKQRMSKEIADFLFESDNEESEEEEKILDKHEKPEPLSAFIHSTRKMFLLQYALEVKLGEKTRLETIIKDEESRLRKEEAELKLAEQAFDNFLQENDRKAMEAQKKAEQEAKITSEKDEHIKTVEAEILQLKADIYNLKDVYRKYSMYGKFLAAISPEDWRKEQEASAAKKITPIPPNIQAVLKLDQDETLDGDNALYFKQPLELLELFNKLESENLSLIQGCQQAEARLEEGRAISIKTRSELNQQAENLETEIRQLEERIYRERKEASKVEEIIENSVSGESRRGGEDKMLDDLEKSVLKIYEEVIGENEARISTVDMLRHIELRMETLTQEQEILNQNKVEIARVTCEKERRHREKEARMENQRRMEERRNRAALDRALAPPHRPEGRRPVFRSKPLKKKSQEVAE